MLVILAPAGNHGIPAWPAWLGVPPTSSTRQRAPALALTLDLHQPSTQSPGQIAGAAAQARPDPAQHY
jgi:hypothetical protein